MNGWCEQHHLHRMRVSEEWNTRRCVYLAKAKHDNNRADCFPCKQNRLFRLCGEHLIVIMDLIFTYKHTLISLISLFSFFCLFCLILFDMSDVRINELMISFGNGCGAICVMLANELWVQTLPMNQFHAYRLLRWQMANENTLWVDIDDANSPETKCVMEKFREQPYTKRTWWICVVALRRSYTFGLFVSSTAALPHV